MEALKVSEIVEAVGGKLLCGSPETEVTDVCIDSRQAKAGSLFVPIIGERVDAHKFVAQVFAQGATATLTSAGEITDETKAHILVENTQKALGDLAVYYKQRFSIPVIGITGSVGKTSTKEMIAAALGVRYNVLKTAGNQNSNIGVPLTLFRIESGHEIAVIEMGISDFGEMSELADFVHPDTAVVTNIGVAHLAQFKTREHIMGEKMMIAKHFGDANSLYLNCDNDMLKKAFSCGEVSIARPARLYYFGISGEKEDTGIPESAGIPAEVCTPDYYAKNIHIRDGRQCFTFYGGGTETEVSMLQLGRHNVYNAVVALAIAMQYGIAPEEAKTGVENYAGIAMRQQVSHLRDDIKIIDDTYNASPDSIKSGVQVLMSLDNKGRKIACLADVLELGEMSWQCHYDTGRFVADIGIDEVVTVGEMMKAFVKGVCDTKPSVVTHAFDTNEEAAEYIKTVIRPGDALLCKGSRGMHQEEIVDALKTYLK